MILREQENVFLFEFGLVLPAVLKYLFEIICADVVYPPGEKLSEILKVSSNFGICSFVHISRNSEVFCKFKNVLYFAE